MRRAQLALAALALLVAPRAARAEAPPANAGFTPPRLTHFVHASLPPDATSTDGPVDVILTIDVDDAGRPARVDVATSAGDPYDDAAVDAARQFVFEPARLDGKPVPVRVTYRYRFTPAPSPSSPPTGAPVSPAVETATLSGLILGRGERVPLAGVSILLDDGARVTTSDAAGRFELPDVPLGEHTVRLRGPDVGAADVKTTLKRGIHTTVTYWVTPRERYSSTVRGRAVVQEVVEQTLARDEVRHLAGTQGDTLKAVQNLPGVARPPFNGGLLVVWGSAPNDTRTYADGVFIPTLYHFGGLRSTLNADMVQSLSFVPGGYGADHGRGLGGVVSIDSREPRTDGFHGFAQIDLIDVSAMLEGPITQTLSFAAGVRVSWLQLFLPAFVTGSVNASPQYEDYQAKLHWRPTRRDDVELFFFGSDDKLDLILRDSNPALTEAFQNRTFYHRGLLRWLHRFAGGATLTVTPSVGYDQPYGLQTTLQASPFDNTNAELEYNLRAVARVPLRTWLRLDGGLDYEGTRYTLDATQNVGGLFREGDAGGFSGFSGPNAMQSVATDHLVLYTNFVAPYVAAEIALAGKKLVVTPQLRVEIMSFDGRSAGTPRFTSAFVEVEPRLAARWQLHPRVAVSLALGVYHQAPDSPDLSAVFGNPRLTPEFGIHYVAGLDVQVTSTLQLSAQGFYKDLRDLVVRGARATDPALDNDGVGRVYGGELLVRQQLWKNFFGWVSYTLSRSERRDHPGDPWRLFEYDQTHILTILGSYKLPRGFQVGLRFRYATGNPYTPVVRSYYDTNSYSWVPLYGAVYSQRLPSFNQLDLRVDKTFTFNRWKLLLYLDLENVYAAQSAEGVAYNFNFTKPEFLSGLPFLPVLGVRGEF